MPYKKFFLIKNDIFLKNYLYKNNIDFYIDDASILEDFFVMIEKTPYGLADVLLKRNEDMNEFNNRSFLNKESKTNWIFSLPESIEYIKKLPYKQEYFFLEKPLVEWYLSKYKML